MPDRGHVVDASAAEKTNPAVAGFVLIAGNCRPNRRRLISLPVLLRPWPWRSGLSA
jgi:hypothetical protein